MRLLSEKTACRIFGFLALVMFALLFHYSLELTGENVSLDSEHITLRRDSIIFNALKVCCALLGMYFMGKLSGFFQSRKRRNLLLGIGCLISLVISFYWVLNSGTAPQGDQAIIAGFADAFNAGEFYGIQRGGYMAVYSQQLGLVTFLRLLFLVFGPGNYFAFQIFSAMMIPLTVFSGCMVVRMVSDDDCITELYYLFFAVTCFPMYAYTAFVYGDLVSIPFVLLAVWAFLSCIKQFSIWKLIGLGVSIGFSVMLRMNVMIVVIAIMIVVLVKLITKRDRHMLAIGCAVIAGVLSFQLSVRGIYSSEWGEDADALPPLCFIAMGLNDDYGRAGWYNIYALGLFATSDYDVEVANQRALETLHTYKEMYRADKGYMVDFFTRKMNFQWNAPMYQSIVMNNKVVGEQSALIKNIFEGGKAARVLEEYAKVFQLLFYGGILVLLARKLKTWDGIEKYVLLIGIYGGFLFSLMWEAKTRYVFPYLLMGLPYMALGINEAVLFMNEIRRNRRRGQNE